MGTKICIALTVVVLSILSFPNKGNAEEFIVYSVFKNLDFGNPGEIPQKDYYVNMGSQQGVRPGASLEVLRRVSSYDLVNQKLYKDVTFPIAKLKVIHVESNAAIARLEKVFPPEKTPAMNAPGVMVGDFVRPSRD